MQPHLTYALLGPEVADLPRLLRSAFLDGWVASYQVGFGPPLARSSERLRERLRAARSALEKLDAYFDVCLLDPVERLRLVRRQRQTLVRRFGPVEAETIDAAARDALDLVLRLYRPEDAPLEVAEQMRKAHAGYDGPSGGEALEALTARFVVRIDDPGNLRLLEVERVAQEATRTGCNVALELRVDPRARQIYRAGLGRWTWGPTMEVPDGPAHGMVIRDGVAR